MNRKEEQERVTGCQNKTVIEKNRQGRNIKVKTLDPGKKGGRNTYLIFI